MIAVPRYAAAAAVFGGSASKRVLLRMPRGRAKAIAATGRPTSVQLNDDDS